MPNFSIALSGLKADSTALDTIADNLSNMSTTAYKTKTVTFADAFYANIGTSGSGNAEQIGTGTKVASTTTDYTQGSYDTSGMSSSDMAIDGNGFFLVTAAGSSTQYLTRSGAFTEDSSGYLETSSGDYLMGYGVTSGVTDTSKLVQMQIPTKGSVMSASASSEITVTANLDSATATNSTYSSTATLYDSLGTTHTATITYTKTGNNTWDYSVELPASDYTSGTSTPITGSLSFDSSGNLSTVTTGGVTYTVGTATGDVSSIPLSFSGLSDSAKNLSVSWNLLNSSSGQILTQVNSTSATTSALADGYAAGTYSSYAVDTSGMIVASYSNGQTVDVGQIALGDVQNEQGLKALGNGLYATTTSSGTVNIAAAGSGALGDIKDSALEQSNVDISTEFSQLIIAQRAFEANSKSITTFDTVTQETINLIHA